MNFTANQRKNKLLTSYRVRLRHVRRLNAVWLSHYYNLVERYGHGAWYVLLVKKNKGMRSTEEEPSITSHQISHDLLSFACDLLLWSVRAWYLQTRKVNRSAISSKSFAVFPLENPLSSLRKPARAFGIPNCVRMGHISIGKNLSTALELD